MNRIKKLLSHLLVFTLLFTMSAPNVIHAAVDREYKIIHTNDMHGRMDTDKLAQLKTFKDVTNPLLMLDGGDAMQGLPVSNFSKGADMAKIMNAIGYDAMAVGNHEFDFGQAVALGEEDGFGSILNFPLLSSNTFKGTDHIFDPSVYLGAGGTETTQSSFVEREGLLIPIVGATTPETLTKTHPDNIVGLHWEDPLETVTTELLKYKDMNPDFYVVVTHLGTDKETKEEWRSDYLAENLATQESTKDMKIVIIDGHSHSKENLKHGNVLLVQTGEHLGNVGVVTVNLDDWTKTSGELIPFDTLVETYEPDPVIKALLETARQNFEDYGSEVLIEGNTIHFDGLRDNVRTRGTNLGNAISDALVWYSETTGAKADLAVVNGGGIRSDILPGDVTLGDVIATIPFGNIYSLIDVSGQNIIDMFEHSVRTSVQLNADGSYKLDSNGQLQISANGGFLHVSESIKLTYDPLREAGSRVVEVLINGVPVNPEGAYKLATNDFLAVGGDGYEMLGGPRSEGPSMDTIFADYLNATKADLSKYADNTVQTRILKTEVSVEEDVSVEALQTLIDKAVGYRNGNYTEETYDPFDEAYIEAVDLVATINNARARMIITQDDVDAAYTKLDTAIKNLVAIEAGDLNTKRLQELVDGITNYKKADYTENSYKVYEEAITKGAALLTSIDKKEDVTQTQIDDAVKDIENAIAALVKVKKDGGTLPSTGITPEKLAIVPIGLILAGTAITMIAKRKKD